MGFGVSQSQGCLLEGVPFIRIIVFRRLDWGLPSFGRDHLPLWVVSQNGDQFLRVPKPHFRFSDSGLKSSEQKIVDTVLLESRLKVGPAGPWPPQKKSVPNFRV